MPTYEYCCDKCHREFAAMHKISEPAPDCPDCGGHVTKRLSAPAVHGGGARDAAPGAQSHSCGAGTCGCRH